MLVRYFDNYNSYHSFYEGAHERGDVVDIVRYTNVTVADAVFTCKRWQTAVKRLAKATEWSWVLDKLDDDGCYNVSVNQVGANLWFVSAKHYN